MAKKRRVSQSVAAKRRRETARVEKAARAAKKRRPKIKAYNQLVKNYVEAQRGKGKKTTYARAAKSAKFKKLYKSFKSGGSQGAIEKLFNALYSQDDLNWALYHLSRGTATQRDYEIIAAADDMEGAEAA